MEDIEEEDRTDQQASTCLTQSSGTDEGTGVALPLLLRSN